MIHALFSLVQPSWDHPAGAVPTRDMQRNSVHACLVSPPNRSDWEFLSKLTKGEKKEEPVCIKQGCRGRAPVA